MKTKKRLIISLVAFMAMFTAQADEWIRINRLGYLPQSIKVAVFMSEEETSLSEYQLIDASRFFRRIKNSHHFLRISIYQLILAQ